MRHSLKLINDLRKTCKVLKKPNENLGGKQWRYNRRDNFNQGIGGKWKWRGTFDTLLHSMNFAQLIYLCVYMIFRPVAFDILDASLAASFPILSSSEFL
jgi:hypothetical protein